MTSTGRIETVVGLALLIAILAMCAGCVGVSVEDYDAYRSEIHEHAELGLEKAENALGRVEVFKKALDDPEADPAVVAGALKEHGQAVAGVRDALAEIKWKTAPR